MPGRSERDADAAGLARVTRAAARAAVGAVGADHAVGSAGRAADPALAAVVAALAGRRARLAFERALGTALVDLHIAVVVDAVALLGRTRLAAFVDAAVAVVVLEVADLLAVGDTGGRAAELDVESSGLRVTGAERLALAAGDVDGVAACVVDEPVGRALDERAAVDVDPDLVRSSGVLSSWKLQPMTSLAMSRTTLTSVAVLVATK